MNTSRRKQASGLQERKHLPKRTEMVSVRLDPKVRYAAEIAARSQRRTVSSLIEVAVATYLPTLEVMAPVDEEGRRPLKLMKLMETLWDPDEADRFVNLAENYRWLLNNEEEHRWKAIRYHFNSNDPLTFGQRSELRDIYDDIKEKVATTLRDKETANFDKR